MHTGNTVVGNIGVDSVRRERTWTGNELSRVRLVGEIIANAILRQQKDREIALLKERLEAENVYLRDEIELKHSHEEIVGESRAIKSMLVAAEQVADTDSSVLILGETGTGKELLARAIHRSSLRRDRPLVAVNCAALSPTLIESELFGREKGAYTGAVGKQIGRFEIADGCTIFLDEIGELPLEVQTKLLRVLQSGELERLGSPRTMRVDVRVVAATNRDLTQAIREGAFREDLFYRLNVFPIIAPPLRDRSDDIPLLVWAFVREFERTMGRHVERISTQDIKALTTYPWPGNVRELRNRIERAMILCRGSTLTLDIPSGAAEPIPTEPLKTLAETERDYINRVLKHTGWRVSGERGAAKILGLKPTTLESRMKKLGIRRR
jgi:transcriptional regulator with GAF, ATPase, and Fis domain